METLFLILFFLSMTSSLTQYQGARQKYFHVETNKYFQAQQRIDLLREKCQENQGRSHKVGFCVIRDV